MNLLTLMALPGCDCGTPSDLGAVTNPTCFEDIGQIQRGFLVKKGSVIWDTTLPANNIPIAIASDLITEEAGWATLILASGDTKVVVTPLSLGFSSTITPGSALTVGGGDNSTPNGEIRHNGFNPADFTIAWASLDKAQIKTIRGWGCSNVEFYPINQEGKILARLDDSSGSDLVTGFPLVNFRLGAKENLGFGQTDTNTATAQFEANYDEFLTFYAPTDFSALLIE